MTCLLAVGRNPPSWHWLCQYDHREDDDSVDDDDGNGENDHRGDDDDSVVDDDGENDDVGDQYCWCAIIVRKK